MHGGLYAESELPDDGRPHWEIVRALFEFKRTGQLDRYDDKPREACASGSRQDICREVTALVAHTFANHHRTVVFMFLVIGRKVCVTRWDHGETIITESFDYIDDRPRLRDILYGFSLLSRDEQGLDPTATLLTKDDDDFETMDEVAKPCEEDVSEVEGTVVASTSNGPYTLVFTRDAFRLSIEDPSCRYRLTVPSVDGNRYFLVGKPTFVAPGISGRGTRGFIAWDVSGQQFVFLKDAWRPRHENVRTEGKVLRELRAAGVPNIPTIICDGELDQVTRLHALGLDPKPTVLEPRGTKRKAADSHHHPCGRVSSDDFVNGGKNLIHPLRHYRIVVEEVCLPLCDFKSGKQLVSIVRDCVQGK